MPTGSIILWALLIFLIWFTVVEILVWRHGGETMSRYVIRKATEGSTFYRFFVIAFPLLIFVVGFWLMFHFKGFCLHWGLLCWLDV